MQTANRATPHLVLGIFTLLSLGALVLSLDTAPPVAQTSLRSASANVTGASSFVLTDVVTQGPPGSSPTGSATTKQEALFVYQAPDRVQETVQAGGQTGTVLWLGQRAYERIGNSKWFPLRAASSRTSSTGQLAAAQLLFPLQSIAHATSVTKHGAIYVFTPSQEQLLLTRLFGSQLPSGSLSFEATVGNEYLDVAQISIVGVTERRTVDLALSRIDHAPALEAPPPSQISSSPLG
jgi:hypothetical protein